MSKNVLLVLPVLAVALAAISIPVMAIGTPTVTVIPDKISKGGAFIVAVDPAQTQNESIAVFWSKDPGSGEVNGFGGSFPRAKGKYVCFFSSTDNESTCGPAIFKVPDPARKLFINVTNQDGMPPAAGKVVSVPVGNIQVQPTVFLNQYGNISIRWPVVTYEPSQLFYKLYFANNLTEASAGAVSSNQGYAVDLAAGPGEYFISLRIDHPTAGFGGTVARIVIPEGFVVTPAGQPAAGSLRADAAAFEVYLDKNTPYQRTNFAIINTMNSTIGNLSVVLPNPVTPYMSITLSNNSVGPNGTVYYTVNILGAQNSLQLSTTANITTATAAGNQTASSTVGQIPVNINVSILGGSGGGTVTCPATTAGSGLTISPVTWTGDYLVGSTATGTFSLSNSGNSTATGINYTSGVNRLSVQPPATVAAGGLGTVTANMTAVTSGKRSGVVTITSSQGSASVVVLLNFYDDINSSVTGLVEELASMKGQLTASQQTALASAFSDIDDDINSATGAQSSGNYQSALDYYNRAAAKKESLSNALSAGFTPVTPVAPSAPIDMSTIIIIVAVVAIVVLVVFVIKKRRAGGKDVEEELAEEFGPVESGA